MSTGRPSEDIDNTKLVPRALSVFWRPFLRMAELALSVMQMASAAAFSYKICLFLVVIVCDRHILSVSVTDSICLSQTIVICHRKSLSVRESMCLSQTVCFCHTQSVSYPNNLIFSQTVCVCQR